MQMDCILNSQISQFQITWVKNAFKNASTKLSLSTNGLGMENMNHKPNSQLTLKQQDSISVEYLAPDVFFIGSEYIHIAWTNNGGYRLNRDLKC